jgi:hypothetical protein
LSFEFGKNELSWVPTRSRSIEINELGENVEIIYGAQSLTGKILSRKELGAVAHNPYWHAFALVMICSLGCGKQ